MPTKGQAQIIQFILFFMIGLSVFLVISGVLKGRVDFYSGDIADANRKLVNTYFSSLIAQSMLACKGCDNFQISTKISNTTTGLFTEVGLTSAVPPSLVTISKPGDKQFSSVAHNMMISVVATAGSGISIKPIILFYSNDKNILRIFQ